MRVLVTRPAEDGRRTADLLRARGHEPVLAPLFEARGLDAAIPADVDRIVAASANAVRKADSAALRPLLGLPFLAVGDATAMAAREAGFRAVVSAQGDSRDLARILAGTCAPGERILHLAGRPRRDEAIAALDGRFRIAVAEIYEMVAAEMLPEIARAGLRAGNLDAVLHLSPRAARVFGDLAAEAGLLAEAQRLRHVFISDAAVDGRFPIRKVAERPSLESVIDAL